MDPEEYFTPTEYANYREVRLAGLCFSGLGLLFAVYGLIAISGLEDASLGIIDKCLLLVVGILGFVGGIAIRGGSRKWSWLAKMTAWSVIWVFPIGTILSLTVLGGLRQYLRSVAKLNGSGSVASRQESGGEQAQYDRYVAPVVTLECPRCSSHHVERRPPSTISPNPGYHCLECGFLMRDFGMFLIYLIVLIVGFALTAFFFLLSMDGRILLFPAGIVCGIYAIRQLMRPVPRRVVSYDGE